MAHPSNFPGANLTFKAPEGRDDVQDLHTFSNGVCVVSCWDLTDAEIEQIVRTRQVWLSVMCGPNFFPTYVGSESTVRSVVVDYGRIW